MVEYVHIKKKKTFWKACDIKWIIWQMQQVYFDSLQILKMGKNIIKGATQLQVSGHFLK
jgi:hypothetical protein